jgi:uncharacterized YigZ family protein
MPEHDDTYLTVATTAEGVYKEKGSKFIALVYPVRSEEQIKETLAVVRKKYYDARHHCYAFILGEKGQLHRANDDGEPTHSAGDPILGQIRSYQVTDVLVVVVRYFGGTKLGVSGLINAYKTATSQALAQAQVIEKIIQAECIVSFDYVWMNAVMKLVKEYEMEIISQQFAERCEITLSVRRSLLEEVKLKFAQLDVTVN